MKIKILIAVFVGILITQPALADEAQVIRALSTRDSLTPVTISDLENMAGSKENLIEILLKHRRSETPPFVGIRSEKLLLNYTENKQVMSALESDVDDAKYFGLARTIGTHLDSVSSSTARTRLATAVLRRAQREKRFTMFGRLLLESKDTQVQRLAREADLN